MEYVAGFMFSNDKDVVVLIIKNKPDWQKGKLNGVGGKVEDGEKAVVAMSREFEEETGVVTKEEDWKNFAVIEDANNEWSVEFFYMFSDDVYNVKSIEDERIVLCSSRSLPEKCIFNLRWLIPLALDKDIGYTKFLDYSPVRKG